MGIGSLDLLVNLLGSMGAIVHYLWRRKSFEANANYVADELDLIAYYLKTGFNIGEQESDGTFLMIYGYSRAFDIALTQSRDKQLGAQVSAALTPYWLRLITQRQEDEGRRLAVGLPPTTQCSAGAAVHLGEANSTCRLPVQKEGPSRCHRDLRAENPNRRRDRARSRREG
jgi:hypothetical protein